MKNIDLESGYNSIIENVIYMKQTFLFFMLTIISCQSPEFKKQQQENAKQDSIAEAKAPLTEEIKAEAFPNYRYKAKHTVYKGDSLSTTDLDRKFYTNFLFHYGKKGGQWDKEVRFGSAEQNKFRLIYKKNLNKLIVYKNNIEFKTYQNPKIYVWTDDEMFTWISKIYVDGKCILVDGKFAPNGLNNYIEYYGGNYTDNNLEFKNKSDREIFELMDKANHSND